MQARASRDWRPAGVPRWWEGRALSQEVRALAPGFVLSAVVAMAAAFAATVQAGPLFPYALFFGIASHHLARDGGVRPGLDFCARSVLRLGVALLGARITADQIAALGESRQEFPKGRLAELILRISGEILNETMRTRFQKIMIEEITALDAM